MRHRWIAAALFLAASMPAAASERWLHLRVQESDGRRTRVEINLPYSVIAVAVPLLPDLEPDECELRINDRDLSAAEMRELLAAIEASPELRPSSIQHEDGTVTGFRRGEILVLQTVDKRFDSEERAEIQVPMSVARALLRRGDERLDLRAAALELVRLGEGQIFLAAHDDSIVRIWVDRIPAGVRRGR